MSDSIGVNVICAGCDNSEHIFINSQQINKLNDESHRYSLAGKRFLVGYCVFSKSRDKVASCLKCGTINEFEVPEIKQPERIKQTMVGVDSLIGIIETSFSNISLLISVIKANGDSVQIDRLNEALRLNGLLSL